MVCDRDCFNCKFDDCIQDRMSHEERLEIYERDKKQSNLIKHRDRSDEKKTYYSLHKEERIAYQHQYYQKNKEKVNEYRREYEKRHREEINERKRVRYAKSKMHRDLLPG